jgi:hypothetical protein
MPEIWPNDAFLTQEGADEPLRSFRCLLLMPFQSPRFDHLADVLRQIVDVGVNRFLPAGQIGTTVIERLDWVTSAGAIQHQIWDRTANADLIFCDLTGQNANVMFEAGVCAARKRIEQVIFLRDEFYRVDQPFDIAPFRYVTYSLTSAGALRFEQKLQPLLLDVLVGFPDQRSSSPSVVLPLTADFSGNRDDDRIVTPPFAHRRVRNGVLEFGSLWSFPHSWATIGKVRLSRFTVSFSARFAQVHPVKEHGYIGVGLRSQHFYAPFGHIVYLNRDGSIKMAQPDESAAGYHDLTLRSPQTFDVNASHRFTFTFDDSTLTVTIGDFNREFEIAEMPEVLGPGLIRLQAHMAWMGLERLTLTV